jgi:CPA1 family monovalent cation:H+ antiporter
MVSHIVFNACLVLPLFGIHVAFIYCLLFGALISPTDPIAVIGILTEAKIPKSLETKIAGESLFNDGVGVVVFLTILEIAASPEHFEIKDVIGLFAREALGGLALGIAVGYAGFLLMRSMDNYKVEILLTLAVVMGGYSLANALHVSGPLAMVAAGIIVGNHGKKYAMSETTTDYIDKFWEVIDEVLNAVLFVLMGLELLLIHFQPIFTAVFICIIVIVLCARYVSVFLPSQIIRIKEFIPQKSLLILTWGGLRGGISIALALSLKPEMQKGLWEACTYAVVVFSILVQGLTIGKLAKKLNR